MSRSEGEARWVLGITVSKWFAWTCGRRTPSESARDGESCGAQAAHLLGVPSASVRIIRRTQDVSSRQRAHAPACLGLAKLQTVRVRTRPRSICVPFHYERYAGFESCARVRCFWWRSRLGGPPRDHEWDSLEVHQLYLILKRGLFAVQLFHISLELHSRNPIVMRSTKLQSRDRRAALGSGV